MDSAALMEAIKSVSSDLWGVWFLLGAALVFWMQAGFAMVETGFTRAKNTGNIIMKNLMDFCIGTVMFIAIGFGLFLGENAFFGLIGKPNWQVFTDYANFDWSNFIFNLVFCATAATIVSGAMAERTKFLSYCVYSAVISAVIYPIEAHWTWGGGWLAQLGFHDFAGSNCIHMVGGICALIGAAMVGPRIGKFTKSGDGKVTEVHAFPGHNIPIGALGVFILWLGWYGFNGAAAVSVPPALPAGCPGRHRPRFHPRPVRSRGSPPLPAPQSRPRAGRGCCTGCPCAPACTAPAPCRWRTR